MRDKISRMEVFMIFMAIGNMVLYSMGIWIFFVSNIPQTILAYNIDISAIRRLQLILYLEWIINLVFFIELRKYTTAHKRIYPFVGVYLFISLISRFLTISAIHNFPIAFNSTFYPQFFIAFTSILFGLVLFQLQKEPIALKIRNLLTIMIVLNFLCGLWFLQILTPVFVFVFRGVPPNFVGFIFIVIGGVIKEITLFFSSFVFLIWSRRIVGKDEIVETEDKLWPSMDLYPNNPSV